MRRASRLAAVAVAAALAFLSMPSAAVAAPVKAPRATVLARSVRVEWPALKAPRRFVVRSLVMRRDERVVATLSKRARSFDDDAIAVGHTHTYALSLIGTLRRRAAESRAFSLTVRVPSYLVGAANVDITPAGVVNLGGSG
ncbi:MAG: hypothetical protein H0W70_13630, partial [Actinobacteria bacterium]|nr:hypothetical protein [Actinomycetota bacterium]